MKQLILICVIFNTLNLQLNAQCRQLVWSDEFDGTSLNTAIWSYQTGGNGWGNNELQHYTNRTDNVQVSDGTLKIIAKSESFGGNNYTSGRIISRYNADFKFGRMEARLKLPQTQGIWPAFWMMPTDEMYGGWPRSGEIDIMELLGHEPNKSYATLHTQAASGGGSLSSGGNYTLPSGSFADGFHLFAVEWTASDMKFYIDNQLVTTKTPANFTASPRPWPFDQRFYFLLNVAVGGDWPGAPNGSTIFPQTMEVDYVRVYQSLGDAGNINGSNRVAQNTPSVYSVPTTADATYVWSVDPFGEIMTGQGTATPSVKFRNAGGTVSVSANSATCGNTNTSLFVATQHNLLFNPSFETDLSQWAAQPNTYGSVTATAGDAYQGSRKITVSVPTAAPNPWDIQLQHRNLNMVAGQPYTLKFWAKADQAGRRVSAAVINATTYAAHVNQVFDLTTNWAEYTTTFTPSQTVTSQLNFDCGRGGTFYFDYVLLGQRDLVLPIELIYFNGKKINNSIEFNWTFGAIENIQTIDLQRSDNGFDFKTIVQNSHPKLLTDNFTENTPLSNLAYFRLKMTERDGSISYSKTLSFAADSRPHFKIFPNPTTDRLTVQAIGGSFSNIEIVDILGKTHQITPLSKNTDFGEISTKNLINGTYFLKIKMTSGQIQTLNFVKN